MAGKITDLTAIPAIDPANDVLEIVDVSANASYKVTPQGLFTLTSNAVSLADVQTLTNKTLTAPTISSPIFSGTITGTYTIGGTPTFPTSVVTLTGSQTLTNKILTSPTINAPTLTNASMTADAITGFTSANTGTIYGVAITASKLPGTSIANSSVGPNQLGTGATVATVATSETTTSTSYADLATTTDTVTVTIGVNGLAWVSVSVNTFGGSNGQQTFTSYAVSGANTIAASDTVAVVYGLPTTGAGESLGASRGKLLTGLATGSTTFKMKYKTSTGTGTFADRSITVIPL